MERRVMTFGMGLMVITACGISGDDDATRIAVEHNALDVVELELSQMQDDGDRVFELRGVDSTGAQVALVRQRIGDIEDIGTYLPGEGLYGSEHIIGADVEARLVSRETRFFDFPLAGFENDPTFRSFVTLPEVRTALRTLNINVEAAPERAETSGETAYGYLWWNDVIACPTQYLNTTPPTTECCYTAYKYTADAGGYYAPHTQESRYTIFKPSAGPNAGLAIWRTQTQSHWARQSCAGYGGVACSGADCYFGPNGFGRPIVYANSQTQHVFQVQFEYDTGHPYEPVQPDEWYFAYKCELFNTGSTANPGQFPNATGTFPTGQGCPGGGTGAGLWDY